MKVEIGKRYRHYKGKEYTILAIARHSETLEEHVIYRAEYDSEEFGNNAVWVRPREMFEGEVAVHGAKVSRFELIMQ